MSYSIRALLLAAGFGTRLRPLTLQTPKCLVKIGGEPLLERWLQSLENCNCSKILINTHYLANQVDSYISSRPVKNLDIQISHEKKLLGTAKTLLNNRDHFRDGLCLMIHADNATDFDLNKLIKAHEDRPKQCLMTMLTFDTSNPRSCGIVETDNDGIAYSFHEKVETPPGTKANGAIYAFDYSFIDYIAENYPEATDFSTDILPNMIGKINTYHTYDPLIDIGTPVNLLKANTHWSTK